MIRDTFYNNVKAQLEHEKPSTNMTSYAYNLDDKTIMRVCYDEQEKSWCIEEYELSNKRPVMLSE